VLRNRKTSKALLIGLAAFAALLSADTVRGQEIDAIKAIKVKASYLYNFARFVQWPKDAFKSDKAAFVIGILGDDPFGRILDDTMTTRTVTGHPVKVRRFRWDRNEDRTALNRCHILFVSTSERRRLSEIVSTLGNLSVLIVSDMDGFAKKGGMIGLVLENGRIMFEINRKALERARLKASSKLLSLARIVESNMGLVPRKSTRTP